MAQHRRETANMNLYERMVQLSRIPKEVSLVDVVRWVEKASECRGDMVEWFSINEAWRKAWLIFRSKHSASRALSIEMTASALTIEKVTLLVFFYDDLKSDDPWMSKVQEYIKGLSNKFNAFCGFNSDHQRACVFIFFTDAKVVMHILETVPHVVEGREVTLYLPFKMDLMKMDTEKVDCSHSLKTNIETDENTTKVNPAYLPQTAEELQTLQNDLMRSHDVKLTCINDEYFLTGSLDSVNQVHQKLMSGRTLRAPAVQQTLNQMEEATDATGMKEHELIIPDPMMRRFLIDCEENTLQNLSSRHNVHILPFDYGFTIRSNDASHVKATTDELKSIVRIYEQNISRGEVSVKKFDPNEIELTVFNVNKLIKGTSYVCYDKGQRKVVVWGKDKAAVDKAKETVQMYVSLIEVSEPEQTIEERQPFSSSRTKTQKTPILMDSDQHQINDSGTAAVDYNKRHKNNLQFLSKMPTKTGGTSETATKPEVQLGRLVAPSSGTLVVPSTLSSYQYKKTEGEESSSELMQYAGTPTSYSDSQKTTSGGISTEKIIIDEFTWKFINHSCKDNLSGIKDIYGVQISGHGRESFKVYISGNLECVCKAKEDLLKLTNHMEKKMFKEIIQTSGKSKEEIAQLVDMIRKKYCNQVLVEYIESLEYVMVIGQRKEICEEVLQSLCRNLITEPPDSHWQQGNWIQELPRPSTRTVQMLSSITDTESGDKPSHYKSHTDTINKVTKEVQLPTELSANTKEDQQTCNASTGLKSSSLGGRDSDNAPYLHTNTLNNQMQEPPVSFTDYHVLSASTIQPLASHTWIDDSGYFVNTFAFDNKIFVNIKEGDITKENAQVIVNSTNSDMTHVAGLSKAIAVAAGSKLISESNDCIKTHGKLKTGEVVCTSGGSLPCRYVLHAVSPKWEDYDVKEVCIQMLCDIIYRCFVMASERHCSSIALPALSSGLHAVPKPFVAKAIYDATTFFVTKFHNHLKYITYITTDQLMVQCIVSAFQNAGQVNIEWSNSNKNEKESHMHQEASSSNPCVNITKQGPMDVDDEESLFSASETAVASTDRKDVQHNAERTEEQASNITTNPSKPLSHGNKQEEDKSSSICSICLDTPNAPEILDKCGHVFCNACIKRCFSSTGPKCPVCGEMYGSITGNQPKNAVMTYRKDFSIRLPGYEEFPTYVIDYTIPSGFQTNDHPHPGQPYRGTTRTAYLPANQEGTEVLSLLQKAWDARLVFTVGQSTTTGRDDVVTWNDIHHKTRVHGGPTRFGYPDPGYLKRVREELAAKGIK